MRSAAGAGSLGAGQCAAGSGPSAEPEASS